MDTQTIHKRLAEVCDDLMNTCQVVSVEYDSLKVERLKEEKKRRIEQQSYVTVSPEQQLYKASPIIKKN
jgi:hypothetical protein